MVVYYVKNGCSGVPPADDVRPNAFDYERTPDLPVLDAQAYIEGAVPIPESSTFLMSRMWEHGDVIALDFRDSRSANAMFGRLSAFVEINGKTKIPSLDKCPPGNCNRGEGYDLRLSDVADFYNFALLNSLDLSDAEKQLLECLCENGLFKRADDGTVRPTMTAALFATSRDYGPQSRREIFVHEYSHALYFIDPEFRAIVHEEWQSLKPEEQRFLKGAMVASGFYESGKEWLMETEAQAHGIADPISDDGFVNILGYAHQNCSAYPDSDGCEDFYSYDGDIRSAIHAFHHRYREASECEVPFTSGWRFENGLLTSQPYPDECADEEIPSGTADDESPSVDENEHPKEHATAQSHSPFIQALMDSREFLERTNSFDRITRRRIDQINNRRYSALLDGIQATLDRKHGKK